jgi:hypothetical protein
LVQYKQQPTDLYLKLKQQISLENKVFSSKNNNLFTALTLVCDSCFDNQYIKKEYSKIIDRIDINSLDISFATEYSLLYYLSKKNHLPFPNNIKSFIKEECINTITISAIPINNRAITAYILKQANYRNAKLDISIKELYSESIELLSNGKIISGIDGLFGVPEVSDNDLEKIIYYFEQNREFFNREKIAKLSVKLLEWNCDKAKDLLHVLYDLIDTEFKSWVEPDIHFALIESEKLINSNLPPEVINEILLRLKNTGESWTSIIDTFLEKGVVVDLKSFQPLPNFSPSEDTWSLLALEAGNLTHKYELSEEEYNSYNHLRKLNSKVTMASFKGSLTLYTSSILITAGLSLWIYLNWIDIKTNWESVLTINISPTTIKDVLNLVFNKLFIIFFVLWWLFNILKCYWHNKDLSIKSIFKCIPIIKWIIKLLSKE